jgi:ABC-type multidrug transport system fused ATPase/permease subunit
MSNNFDKFNVRTLADYFKNKNLNIHSTFNTSKFINNQKIKRIKNLGKKMTVTLASLMLLIDTRLFLLSIGNIFLYMWFKSACNRIDARNKIKKQKLEKFKNKDAGVLKRMENLKQFKQI